MEHTLNRRSTVAHFTVALLPPESLHVVHLSLIHILYRECHRQKLSDEEQQALSELERILSETPQWSSEEELHHDMANIGGRVWYCHYWEEHYSMLQLTEDRNGRFNTAYVLDRNTSPEMRREAARCV